MLSGHGSTTIETSDGRKHSFEWGPKSLFAMPLNARYQHFNASGRERARIASTMNLALMLNLFHNEAFVFDNPLRVPGARRARQNISAAKASSSRCGPAATCGRRISFPTSPASSCKSWDERGAGGSNMMFILADGTMHAHISEMPVGTYKKAHRHGADFHVMRVTGHGYSLLWYEGEQDFGASTGSMAACSRRPTGCSTSTSTPRPIRRAISPRLRQPALSRSPPTSARVFMGMDVSVKEGGRQIEYEHQDPRIHAIYLDELRRHGVQSAMGKFIDERACARATA